MKLPLFKLEDYLSEREFQAEYMFCSSDMETHSVAEIVSMADAESIALWNNLKLNYTEPFGNPILREEIAKIYSPSIAGNNILCFAGAEEGIFCMSHALLDKDSHAIIVTPCYQSLEAIPSSICEVTKISLSYEDGWQLDLEKIKDNIRPNTKLIIVNYPHNPTGAMITVDEQRKLIEICREKGIWLFSDEVYRLLELDQADRLPPMASQYEKGFSLGVMSKAYGLAGLRIGWITCQDKEALQKMSNLKHYLSICNSAPSEVLSLMALRSSEKVLSRNLSLMRDNINKLDQFFENYSTWFEWKRPKGGCVGFPRLKASVSIESFAEQLMEKCSVLLLPGSVFDASGNHFRISFGRKIMPEALNRFQNFIEQHQSKLIQ